MLFNLVIHFTDSIIQYYSSQDIAILRIFAARFFCKLIRPMLLKIE